MRGRILWLSLSLAVACGLVGVTLRSLEADEPKETQKPAEKTDKPEKPGEKPKDEVKPPAVNPLQELFQKLIPRQTPQQIEQPPRNNINPRGVAPKAQVLDPDARDQIDARAAKDRKQAELLRKASAAAHAQDWQAALEWAQTLLAQEEDSVSRVDNGWVSVREQAMRLMLRIPEDVLRGFRQRIGAEAARRLDEAEESGRIDRLAHIAMRFLVLEQGQSAAQRLAVRHLDRGEFALATRWFRWLDDAKASITRERHWQLQAALAAKQAGDKDSAEKWLKKNSPNIEEGSASRPTLDDEQIEMGGTKIRVNDWWSALPGRVVAQTAPAEWPMFFGAANRAALSRGGEPLLLPRWRQPLTQMQPLQRQIEMLVEDMHDQNRATISVCQPLLVNGCVVLRTLGGVQVFDVETGRALWSTAERFTAEDLLGPGQTQPTYSSGNRVIRVVNGVRQVDYSNTNWEQHPIAQLLFANGNFGALSSDGRQLFSVEDDTFVMQQMQMYWGNNDPSKQDALRRSWTSNKLVSYDLRNGRPLWAVGGSESSEAFQPELPGVFFFGAPVADGHELFVIGERDGEIRLFCLQAETGKPLWTQLLATAETVISRDIARRQFVAQVSISDGLVICPTTVGWLAAVDRASRQLRWVHRYSAPQVNNPRRGMVGQPVTQLMPWGQRWLPSAPVVVGDAVVYTPQELFDELQTRTTNIVCLGLHDGARRWLKPKENWLALNGVADGKVLLLGQTSIGALSLTNGDSAWNLAITPNTDGVPSGLGAIAGDRWHVPLSSGQVWTLSLKDGSRTGRQWANTGTRLGNLALYRGGVISAHPAGLTCFEQRESIAEQIRQRQQRDPDDVFALLTEASILQLEHKSNDAWGLLKRVKPDTLSAELRPRYLDALREVLSDVIPQDPSKLAGDRTAELATFEKWLTEPDDQLQAKRLRIEHQQLKAHQTGDRKLLLDTLELLLQLSRDESEQVLVLSGSPAIAVRLDAWVEGQLLLLWGSVKDEKRADVDARIVEEIQSRSRSTPAERRRVLDLFAFHPATRELRWQEIEHAISERDVSRAELTLLRLVEGQDSLEAARAWQRLVELYRSLDLKDDAAAAGQQLSRLNDAKFADGSTAKQWVEKEVEAGRLARTTVSHAPDWSTLEFKMQRSMGYQGNAEQVLECTLPDARWPFFTAQRFQYQMLNGPISAQRLAMSRLGDSQFDWSLPLRNKLTSNMGYGTVIRTVGHQMLVYHREVLHLLSPLDHRVVWTRPLESRAVNYLDPMQAARRQTQPMQTSAEFQSRPVDPTDEMTRNSLLTLCTPELIGYRGRRVLTVTDAATGQWRWELRDLPNDARVQATNDFISVASASRWPNGLLLRARDGQSVPLVMQHPERFQSAKMSLGSDLLVVSKADANTIAVERWNPLAQKTVWRDTFPTTNQFSWLDARTLATLDKDGKLATLDIDTHESQTLGTVKPADLSGLNHRRYLVADHDRLFLIVSGERTNFYGDEFATVPVNGTMFAFDRRAGGELWRQKVDNQGLILNHFGASPVLLFSTRRFELRGRIQVQVQKLLMLDKKTGRKQFEEEFTNQFSGYRGLNLNLAERQIELLTYNDRLKLIGSEPSKAEK